MARRRPAQIKEAPLSQRDQALLKVSRLLEESRPPAPEAEAEDALVNLCDLAETSPITPPRRPLRPARPAVNPLWRALEVIIILVVVVWVFLLGVLVGRSRLGEDGQGLAGWLENKSGRDAPALIIRPAPEAMPGLDTSPDFDTPLGFEAPSAFENPPDTEALSALPDFESPTDSEAETTPGFESLSASESPAAAAAPTLFSVQAALAFEETEARNMADRLAAQGFTAYFYQSGSRFPVRVGPFPSRAEAEEARRRLESLGYNQPYVSRLR